MRCIWELNFFPSFYKYFMRIRNKQKVKNHNIQHFIEYLSFKDLNYHILPPSEQEEQRLLQILYVLNQNYQHFANLKGIWNVLCLLFQNYSGLALMTFYFQQLSSKLTISKQFSQDLKYLNNKAINWEYIEKVFSVLQAQQQILYEQFHEWYDAHKYDEVDIGDMSFYEERIFQEQFASEPDTLVYDLLSVFTQEQYTHMNHNRSFQNQFEEYHPFYDNQETISFNRKVAQQIKAKKKGKLKKAKHKKVKQKMFDQVKRLQKNKRTFLKKKNKKKKEKRSYYQNQACEEIQKSYKRTSKQKLAYKPSNKNRSRRKERKEKENISFFHNQSELEQVIGNIQEFYISNQEVVEVSEEECEDRQEIIIYNRSEEFYEQLKNIDIRVFLIKEQKNYRSLNRNSLYEYIDCMNEKQRWGYVKKKVNGSLDQVGDETTDTEKLIQIMYASQIDKLYPYKYCYLQPTRDYLLLKIICKVLSQHINLYFTSSSNENTQLLNSYYQHIFFAFSQIENKQTFIEALYSTLISLIAQPNQITKSLIAHKQPIQVLYSLVSIPINQQDKPFITLLVIYIFNEAYIPILLQQHQHLQVTKRSMLRLQNEMAQTFSQKIRKKSQFVGYLATVYNVHQIPITITIRDKLLKFINYIDFEQMQSEKLFYFMRYITKSFINTKINEQNRPNFKPLLNKLLKNDLLMKGFQSENMNWLRIFIEILQVILQFDIFHNDFTFEEVLISIGKICECAKRNKKVLHSIFNILSLTYRLKVEKDHDKINREFWNIRRRNFDNIINKLQEVLTNYYIQITQQFQGFFQQFKIQESTRLSAKLQKYKDLVINFLKFLSNQYKCILHPYLCLQMLLHKSSYFWKSLNENSRQGISEQFVNCTLAITHSIKHIHNYAIEGKIQSSIMREGDDQDQVNMNMLCLRNQLKPQLYSHYSSFFSQIKLSELLPKCHLHLQEMQDKTKKYYQFVGFFLAHTLIYSKVQVIDNLKLLQTQHLRQVSLFKKQIFIRSSYELILNFLHTFFHNLRNVSYQNSVFNNFMEKIKHHIPFILDILFISLNIGEQQESLVIEIVELIKPSPVFKQSEHFLSKYLIDIRKHNIKNLYKKFLQLNEEEARKLATSINGRYKTFLSIVIKYIKIYEGWQIKKSQVINNVFQFYIFLLKCPFIKAQTIKDFQVYFKLFNSQNQTGSSYLKSLILRQDTVKNILEYLIIIQEKQMHRLNQVKDYYGGYIVNKILHKNKDNNYHDIETIIRVCEESQDFRKPITLFLIQTILMKLIQKIEISYMKKQILAFYFKLFKKYPFINSILLKIMDKFLEQMKKYAKQKILDIEHIQDGILKYVIHEESHFNSLYSTISLLINTYHTLTHAKIQKLKYILNRILKYQILNHETLSKFQHLLSLLSSIQNRQQHYQSHYPS